MGKTIKINSPPLVSVRIINSFISAPFLVKHAIRPDTTPE